MAYCGESYCQEVIKNRPAGTPVTKNINTTREVYIRMLKENVFPAIRKKWPGRKTALVKVCSKITPAVMSTKITEK
ncbi:hypothetical protein F442_09113 [Phytophthora nicotianae P10297]|uniref:Uncharacterized protein n=3 Tax=Phytophthora nicotianae TaxID=4792 RepID=W2PCK5_PHYN3|nr:hypothetical protein PPTG_20165 [Phytophthora nicotianae INRA-310]ETK85780.1 hypothetical protein L915_09507 [Phytophthora nicotianae]ETL39208.1 hypothetical protein L916_09410 [Phytophthora nicotianae]ETM97744.1 hypothetical protein PPTG_20165 [Phytophthora nicotianae INRA-310]ETP44283.1 hypothetical protein F442_09113 [Phytophthora nicotianae P10297]